ncbi:MAG: hypothetical protein ABI451_00395 [Dokdonella sp.]
MKTANHNGHSRVIRGALRASLLVGALVASGVHAQSLGDIAAANMAFDQRMDMQARQFANDLYNQTREYRQRTGDYSTPMADLTGTRNINAGSISRSVTELSNQYSRNNDAWSNQFNNTQNPYADGAIRGQATYVDPNGYRYEVQGYENQYWIDPNTNTIVGNDGTAPPDYQNNWQQLQMQSGDSDE